ncbi:MAG: MBL fold metallo-hydrolase [Nitrospirota bacterium]
MKIENIMVGPLQSNCYIIYDEKSLEAIVVDPGDEPEKIISVIEDKKLKINYIVCTHGHFDHIGAVANLKEKTGAKIIINKNDIEIYMSAKDQAAFWGYDIEQPPEPDIYVMEGDEIFCGNLKFQVLHTPGHSPGGISLYGENIILTGDTVFAGSVGRTDFYGGSIEELKKSFRRIISLPPETRILPGHGEWTKIIEEKKSNFFIQEL